MVLQSNPVSFFYFSNIDQPLQTITQQTHDGLIEYNLQTYAIEPALAESWTITNGGTVYTFKLRRGVKWSDGKDFTADDVVFTFNQIVQNPEARGGEGPAFTYDGKPVVWTKIDNFTVRATVAKAAPGFIQQLRTFIMPKHKLLPFSQEGGKARAEINNAWPTNVDVSEVVGTGPFRLTSYTPGQRVVLSKNPNYWKRDSTGNTLPYLDRLEYLIIQDPQAQLAQFLAGNLGYINATGAQFPDLKQREVGGAPFKVLRSLQLFGGPNSTVIFSSTSMLRMPTCKGCSATPTSAKPSSRQVIANALSMQPTTVWPKPLDTGFSPAPLGTTTPKPTRQV